MQFTYRPMDEPAARAIAQWRYEGLYAFYNMDQDLEDLAELLDPRRWPNTYYAVMNEDDNLVGFFYFEHDQETVVIGLGLRPDLTGQGLGRAFLEAGLRFARSQFHPRTFRLAVATFNQRAIRVYAQVGFSADGVMLQVTNGGEYEFLRMVREA